MKAVRVELVVMTVRDQALDVLLVRYPGNEWALPGGSATPPRQVEAAAVEILAEQTGVRDISLEQLYTFDRDQGPEAPAYGDVGEGSGGPVVCPLAVLGSDHHGPGSTGLGILVRRADFRALAGVPATEIR